MAVFLLNDNGLYYFIIFYNKFRFELNHLNINLKVVCNSNELTMLRSKNNALRTAFGTVLRECLKPKNQHVCDRFINRLLFDER